MGFLDKIRDLVNAPEEEEYAEDSAAVQEETEASATGRDVSSYSNRSSHSAPADRRGSKVVNFHSSAQLQVVLVKPETFNDAAAVVDQLNNKRSIVLNMETTNPELARRLVDFFSGAAYAIGGKLKPVANSTFIITPPNVDFVGDSMLDELEGNGFYF